MAAGAVGASGTPAAAEPLDGKLVWRLDVLGLRRMGPVLVPLRAATGGMATRVVPPLCVTLDDWSTIFSTSPCDSRMLPLPVGEGNWVSLNSVEADSRLLWRSSKLTEGRKSYETAGSATSSDGMVLPPPPPTPPFLPKEKSEWLLAEEALSIGTSSVGRRIGAVREGLMFCLPLK